MIKYIHSAECSSLEIYSYLKEISSIEKKIYGENFYRNLNFLYSLYLKNSSSFFFAIDNHHIVGYVDIFPLTSFLYHNLLLEKISEEYFPTTGISCLSYQNSFWYIGSFIILTEYQKQYQPNLQIYEHLAYLLWNYLYEKNIFFPIQIFGVASSQKGALMMQNWNFQKLNIFTSKNRYERKFSSSFEILKLKKKYYQKLISLS